MKNNTILRKVDQSWILTQDDQTIELPSTIFFDSIWDAVSMLLQIYTDDAGANLDRCVDYCRKAGKLFAGASEVCQIMAKEYENHV